MHLFDVLVIITRYIQEFKDKSMVPIAYSMLSFSVIPGYMVNIWEGSGLYVPYMALRAKVNSYTLISNILRIILV